MRFALITDIHFGPSEYRNNIQRKLTKYAKPITHEFVKRMNNHVQPNFVVQLGDLIQDKNYETDVQNYKLVLDLLSRLEMPLFHLFGNHEQVNIPISELCEIVGLNNPYYSFDFQEYHFICLFARLIEHKRLEAIIDDTQLQWLQNDLQSNDRVTIAFIHYSLADVDLSGNFWFMNQANACLIQNRTEVCRVLASAGRVKIVFNGHLHWNHIFIQDGIVHVTVQSPIENFRNDGTLANTFAIVEISQYFAYINMVGNDSMKVNIPLK